MKTVLHIGCGHQDIRNLPPLDFETEWKEVRLDIDPDVNPDIVDSIVTLGKVADSSVDMVFSKHNIEHLEHHEVPLCLQNIFRVLKPEGQLVLRTPDLAAIAELVLQDRLEDVLYVSRVYDETIPVKPIDMIYGSHRKIAEGNRFMAHRTGFTHKTLGEKLTAAGFEVTYLKRKVDLRELRAVGLKR